MYKFVLRLNDELADSLKEAARLHSNSVNSEIVQAIEFWFNNKPLQLQLLQQRLTELEEAIDKLHN